MSDPGIHDLERPAGRQVDLALGEGLRHIEVLAVGRLRPGGDRRVEVVDLGGPGRGVVTGRGPACDLGVHVVVDGLEGIPHRSGAGTGRDGRGEVDGLGPARVGSG
jgi:hypothetical protein